MGITNKVKRGLLLNDTTQLVVLQSTKVELREVTHQG